MELELWIAAGAVLFLLFLSGFFSGSETALTAASKARMHALEKDGDQRAARVNILRKNKERLIGALLLGNNLVNILASALATSVLIKLFGEAGVVYATLAMTMLVLIFAEVLPKTYALHYADKMAMAIAPVIQGVVFIFSPVTEMVAFLVRQVLKLFGIDTSVVAVGQNVEVLRGAIELHQGTEDNDEDEVHEQRAMLRSILDLEDVDVEDIVVHRKNVEMINVDDPVEDIVEQVLSSRYTRLPLWKDDQENIVGMLHAKVLLRELRQNNNDLTQIDIQEIASEPWFVPETTNLYDQLQAFRQRREHFALVVDEYGSFMGIVTLEDVLEEIVGEIDDEHDITVSGIRPQPDGHYLVSGTVTIRDLNRDLDWSLPDEDYSTVAGLVLYESQSIPDVGQKFVFHDTEFEIVKRQRNQITAVRVSAADHDL
jgi:Mg2+/Co2+ transporter CorB